MEKIYSISELQTLLSPVFASYGVKKATLFGSYAKGAATEKSDIDLLVDSGLHGLSFFGLLESVSNAVRIPVDLIDISQISPGSPVDREIKRTGVDLYAG